MDHFTSRHAILRVVPLVAFISIGWMTYSRYSHKCKLLQHVLKRGHDIPPTILATQPKLNRLSLEVLLEIMGYLEWNELLILRQVCMSLNVATHQRVLWHALIRSSPCRFLLTRRMDLCSSEELEDALIRVKKTDRRWVSPHGPPPRIRDLDGLGVFYRINTMILPGGRWLLKLEHSNNELLYADLNSDNIQWRTLVPPPPNYFNRRLEPFIEIQLVVDVDANAEHLSFNIVISRTIHWVIENGINPTGFKVWGCTSEFDEQGLEIGLGATLLSEFEERHFMPDWGKACLRGNIFALFDNKTRCVVIDWKLANGHGKAGTLPRFIFPHMYGEDAGVAILPNNKLLCLTRNRWDVMTWENMLPTTGKPIQIPDPAFPVVSINNPPALIHLGAPHIRDNIGSYMTCSAPNRVICCSFPIPDLNRPSQATTNVTTLYSFPPDTGPVVFTEHRALLRLSEEWLNTGVYTFDPVKGYVSLEVFRWDNILPSVEVDNIIVDDISGRSIFLSSVYMSYFVDF